MIDITLEPTSIAKLLNESFCQSNFACGIDSVCYKGVCRCNSGFKWNNYSYSCERIKCTNDRQCTKLFENTTCNSDTKTCQCLQSYELIRESQQCIMKIIPGHLTRTIIFVPISVVLLIVLIVGGGSGRWYYVRYYRPNLNEDIRRQQHRHQQQQQQQQQQNVLNSNPISSNQINNTLQKCQKMNQNNNQPYMIKNDEYY